VAIAQRAQTNGTLASGTTVTITVPTYVTGDFVVLIVSRNQTETNPFTFNANVSSITELANVGTRRLIAMKVALNGTPSTFTLTSVTSSVWTWWIGTYTGVNAALAVANAVNAVGASTASPVPIPTTPLPWISSGTELAVAAAGVNATATWTTDGNTAFASGAAVNAGLMVDTKAVSANALSVTWAAMDRGLSGTSRNESSLSIVLQDSNPGATNLVTNGSFETGTGLPSPWQDEHTTATIPQYTITTSGVVDGNSALNVQYAGVAGDSNAKLEFFEAPISGMVPGDVLQFSCYVSGTLTNTYGFFGIEAFNSSNAYISEMDENFVTVTSTPTKYTVTYTCPAGTDHVAAYMQVPTIGPTVTVNLNFDKAVMIKLPPTELKGSELIPFFL
jgi:hypothetical protein